MKKNCVILKWNPAISSYSMSRFLNDISGSEPESDWSIHEYEKVKAGDRFFMLKVGAGICGIVAAGFITSDPEQDADWSGRGRKVYYADYACEFMVNPETLPIPESRFLENNIPGFDWYGGHSGVVLNATQAEVLERLYSKYLHDHAALFAERIDLMAKRNMDNDQLYMEDDLWEKIRRN